MYGCQFQFRWATSYLHEDDYLKWIFDRTNVAKQLEYIKMEAALKVSQLFFYYTNRKNSYANENGVICL